MDKSSLFRYNMKVRDYECDAQGIVNNANYQHYFEVARHEFLEAHSLNFFDLHKQGIDLVVSSILIHYKNPLHGSEEFICTVDNLEREGYRYYFNQRIVRIEDNKVCSTARVEVVSLRNGFLARPQILDETFGVYFDA